MVSERREQSRVLINNRWLVDDPQTSADRPIGHAAGRAPMCANAERAIAATSARIALKSLWGNKLPPQRYPRVPILF